MNTAQHSRKARPATLLTHISAIRRNIEQVLEPRRDDMPNINQQHFDTQHTTSNGTPDRRFAENRGLQPSHPQQFRQPITKDGTPDLRFKENRSGTQEEYMPEINAAHLTKVGTPDRRYKENRSLTGEEEMFGRQQEEKGHITKDGAPDRRYKEFRALSDDEVELRKAESLLAKHGIINSNSPFRNANSQQFRTPSQGLANNGRVRR